MQSCSTTPDFSRACRDSVGSVSRAILVAPNVDPARAVAQGCSDSETEDSYSLQCVPNVVPDFSDQLTEAEVAEPGFNGGDADDDGGGGGHH